MTPARDRAIVGGEVAGVIEEPAIYLLLLLVRGNVGAFDAELELAESRVMTA